MTANDRILIVIMTFCIASCAEYDPGEPGYVDFFLTVEFTDSDGYAATCGDLGIVRVRAGSLDGLDARCCEPDMDSIVLNLLPSSHTAALVGASAYDADGVGVARGMGERRDGATSGTLLLFPCDECGTLDTSSCVAGFRSLQ